MYRECRIAGGESKIAKYATTTSAEREMLLRRDRKKKKKKKKGKRKKKNGVASRTEGRVIITRALRYRDAAVFPVSLNLC